MPKHSLHHKELKQHIKHTNQYSIDVVKRYKTKHHPHKIDNNTKWPVEEWYVWDYISEHVEDIEETYVVD